MLLQVLALGLLLAPVAAVHAWWITLAFALAMVAAGAGEAASRPALTYDAALRHALVSVGGAMAAAVAYCALLVLPPGQLFQYLIPVLGVMLGSVVGAVGTGMSVVVHECVAGA